jgi:hypothetical protein
MLVVVRLRSVRIARLKTIIITQKQIVGVVLVVSITTNGWQVTKKIEIYWSTDEITKQIWRNDIPCTGNELPRFWRACH